MAEFYVNTVDTCKQLGETGILGLECASGYWGLSSFDWFSNPIFLAYSEFHEAGEFFKGTATYYFVDCEPSYDNTVLYADGIYITNKERTICDMVKFQCQEFHLFEAIFDYYTYEDEESIKRLEDLASSYGVLDQLLDFKQQAFEVYESGEE